MERQDASTQDTPKAPFQIKESRHRRSYNSELVCID